MNDLLKEIVTSLNTSNGREIELPLPTALPLKSLSTTGTSASILHLKPSMKFVKADIMRFMMETSSNTEEECKILYQKMRKFTSNCCQNQPQETLILSWKEISCLQKQKMVSEVEEFARCIGFPFFQCINNWAAIHFLKESWRHKRDYARRLAKVPRYIQPLPVQGSVDMLSQSGHTM